MAELGAGLNGAAGRAPALAVKVERWPITGGFAISRGAKHEAVVVVASIGEAGAYRTGRMRALCPLRRERGGRGGGHRGLRPRRRAWAEPGGARRLAPRRGGAERARLRPVGSGSQAVGPKRRCNRRDRCASSRAHRLHPLARDPRGDGRRRRAKRAAIRCSSSSSAAMGTSSGSGPCARRCLRLGSSPMPTKHGNRMKPNRFWPKRRQQVSSWSSSLYPPATTSCWRGSPVRCRSVPTSRCMTAPRSTRSPHATTR